MRLHAPSARVLGLPLPLVFPLISAGMLAESTGCARSAEERQLDSMQADIENIQHERDGVDPPQIGPEGLPVKAAAPSPPAAPSGAPAATAAPPAEAVRVGMPVEAIADDYADPEDTTPRPAIRMTGVSGGSRGSRRGGEDAFDMPADDSAPAHPLLDPEAKRAYDAALSLVNAKQFSKGIDALAAFLVKWPDHPYADRAMFWRGDCYFAQGDYARAVEQLSGLLARFPASSKTSDALLKLGVAQQKLGHSAEAKECFDRLAQEFSQSEAARHIPSVTVPAAAPSGPAEDPR